MTVGVKDVQLVAVAFAVRIAHALGGGRGETVGKTVAAEVSAVKGVSLAGIHNDIHP